ncbi:hypothetical protein [Acidithiobacillus ferridurans]|jgi:hypothetical protein|uniref:Uncharacterized protein n=1 Tax=Acidithiobacillus ferridurans TaxID=1232575 RepID=A0A8X8GAR1_ACIFI|nr:hypothetical protein [Acidithiobacillus ferridurans]MBU2715596.1 hypothetical protein [Acidithiobacillus ferridurans]MBU2722914.1 hypothetical protein [Acidithiobacillus ferridurans]MBU2728194.1 hypothetical protein [Acidithiobacillus ferridurans]
MFYRFAVQKIAIRLDWASHIVAATVFSSGFFTAGWATDVAAAVAWLAVQGIVFAMNTYAGPPAK